MLHRLGRPCRRVRFGRSSNYNEFVKSRAYKIWRSNASDHVNHGWNVYLEEIDNALIMTNNALKAAKEFGCLEECEDILAYEKAWEKLRKEVASKRVW